MANPGGVIKYEPLPHENAYYDGLFAVADKERTGAISGQNAVSFFSLSKLPVPLLKNIWTMSDYTHTNSLNREEFFTAIRLIQLYQNGEKAKDAALSVEDPDKMLRPAYFESVSDVSVHPPASTPATPQQSRQQNLGSPERQRNAPVQSTALSVQEDPYAMLPQDFSNYERIFNQYKKPDGFVYGAEAVALFSRSGVDKSTLRDIWNMVDDPVDNRIDSLEFALAMHLIVCVSKKNLSLPSTLPQSLVDLKKEKQPQNQQTTLQQQQPSHSISNNEPPQLQQSNSMIQNVASLYDSSTSNEMGNPPPISTAQSDISRGLIAGDAGGIQYSGSSSLAGSSVMGPPAGISAISDAFDGLVQNDSLSVGGGGISTNLGVSSGIGHGVSSAVGTQPNESGYGMSGRTDPQTNIDGYGTSGATNLQSNGGRYDMSGGRDTQLNGGGYGMSADTDMQQKEGIYGMSATTDMHQNGDRYGMSNGTDTQQNGGEYGISSATDMLPNGGRYGAPNDSNTQPSMDGFGVPPVSDSQRGQVDTLPDVGIQRMQRTGHDTAHFSTDIEPSNQHAQLAHSNMHGNLPNENFNSNAVQGVAPATMMPESSSQVENNFTYAGTASSNLQDDDSTSLEKLRGILQQLNAENISLKAQLNSFSGDEVQVKKEIAETVSDIGTLSQELSTLRSNVIKAKTSLVESTSELKEQIEKKTYVAPPPDFF
eukprot:CAMPEP_0194377506 /NCGR_PEP_ID=MMETSP0174-20130528/31500_1 /TAXON_ID=216777 /ORGANISM="Proboscia alata, Strain PI-D3" /LENGTH=707 /DNA_ID=CAMNT_0039158933 /DNA_START=26 /DNA_END=2149 /DNA_ORIENTATION=+